jgi:hypothetical protein
MAYIFECVAAACSCCWCGVTGCLSNVRLLEFISLWPWLQNTPDETTFVIWVLVAVTVIGLCMIAAASFWRDGTIGTLCATGFTLADAELYAATTELCTVTGAAFEVATNAALLYTGCGFLQLYW